MLFNTVTFLIFFIIVYNIYWLNRNSYKRQNLILFVASYVFYGWWDVRFLFLLVISTFIDYTSSILIDRNKLTSYEKAKSYFFLFSAALLLVIFQKIGNYYQWPAFNHSDTTAAAFVDWWVLLSTCGFIFLFEIVQKIIEQSKIIAPKKLYLVWAISLNLAILCVFKYLNFFAESFEALWSWFFGVEPTHIALNIVLPVGVSFFIFQTISHTVDVYWKKIKATSSIIELSTYIAFFPQLVAGPIERGAHLLPQFQRQRTVSWEEKKEAFWLIFWGLYKKVVVADNIAKIVNSVFQPYDTLSNIHAPEDGLKCLIAVYAFAVQIYCDFSGYTDIARGTARLLGFDIMLNFNLPYFSTTPSDFWSRWHISLSSWLRDYLYIPLGGNQKGKIRTHCNLMITMLLGGLWHGASWNFVYWGAFHGMLLIVYDLSKQKKIDAHLNLNGVFKGLLMFHLICIGWLLFRAQNMTTVYVFLEAIFKNFKSSSEVVILLKELVFFSWFLLCIQTVQAFKGRLDIMKNMNWFLKLNIWTFMITSLFSLAPTKPQEFIYFAF